MVDRRYGINQYGDGKLYGASDTRQALAWDVSVDWDGDGLFEANEADRLTGISITRGRTKLLQESGEGFEPIATGKAVITLRNDDGRFDGWNTSSELYPNVNPGKDIRLRVRDLDGSVSPYPLFRGLVTDVVPVGYGDDARVIIYASDGLDLLRNYAARVAIQQAITPDAAIGYVLDSVKWPAGWGRSLDVSAETIPYWWASGNKKAMSEIESLATSFLGYFFADAQGRARYIKRSSVSSAVATFAQDTMLKDISNPQPYEILRNITRLKVHPRTQATTGVLWQLVGTPPSILPGQSLTLFANYSYNNSAAPAINVITPVATTDYLKNTASNGSGTNQTANCTVVMTDFGDTAKIVVTNNSGSTVYVTKLQIRGDAIYEVNTSDVTYPSDPDSVTNPRELLIDLLWQQDVNVAIDITNVLGPFYGGLHPMPSVKIDSRQSLQFAMDLFDIVTVDLEALGLSGESYRVGGIEHQTDSQIESCQRVHTRLYLEPYVSASNYMQWDTNAVWDTSTVFGY